MPHCQTTDNTERRLKRERSIVLFNVSNLMPRKLPLSYVRKLNDEQRKAQSIASKRNEKREQFQAPDSGRMRSYVMICQACGTRAKFTVDERGFATCGNCKAIASYRFGHLG